MYAGRLDAAANAFAAASRGAPPEEFLEYARLELEQVLRRGHLEDGLERASTVLRHVGSALPRTRFAAIRSIVVNRAHLRLSGMNHVPIAEDEVPADTLLRLDVEWSIASAIAFVSPVLGRALQMQFMREALTSGAPKRVAQAFCLELGYLAISGVKNRARCEALRLRALRITEDLDDKQLLGTLEGSAGVASFLFGRWREAYERMAAGEKYLRDNAASARWEIDILQVFGAAALVYLGRFRQLAELLPAYIREADERGDVYAKRGLQGWRSNTLWLALDDPAEASRRVALVAIGDDEFHLHHYYELLARAQIELYSGRPEAAHDRVEAMWRPLRKSHTLRIQSVRIEAWHLRGRCALATAVSSPANRSELLAAAKKAAAKLERESAAWADAFAALLRAGVATLTADVEDSVASLRSAIDLCEATNMEAYAAAAQLRTGQIISGRESQRVVAEAMSYFEREQVANPTAFSDLLVPGQWTPRR